MDRNVALQPHAHSHATHQRVGLLPLPQNFFATQCAAAALAAMSERTSEHFRMTVLELHVRLIRRNGRKGRKQTEVRW